VLGSSRPLWVIDAAADRHLVLESTLESEKETCDNGRCS
jgi:hypothetical protein